MFYYGDRIVGAEKSAFERSFAKTSKNLNEKSEKIFIKFIYANFSTQKRQKTPKVPVRWL